MRLRQNRSLVDAQTKQISSVSHIQPSEEMSQPSKIRKSKSVPEVSEDTPMSTDEPSAAATQVPKPTPAALRHANTRHWLMKNEPPFSLAALKELPEQTEPWVGVRSGEARNMMQHGMKKGHHVLYYNASIANPHIAGIARVASEVAYPDPTAFDPESPYFDAESEKTNPRWHLVDVKYEREFSRPVYLSELRALAAGLHNSASAAAASDDTKAADKDKEDDKEAIENPSSESPPGKHHEIIHPQFTLFRRNRLSIHPLSEKEYEFLVSLESTPLPSYIKLKPEKATGAHPSRNRGSKPKPPTKTVSAPQLGATASVSESAETKSKGKPDLKRASTHGWNKKKRKSASKESDSETEDEADEDEEYGEEEEGKKKSSAKKSASATKRAPKKSKTESDATEGTDASTTSRITRSRK